MLRGVGIVCIFLVLIPVVFPATEDVIMAAQLQEQNRFLSAEVSRQIREEQNTLLAELTKQQDSNFQALDARTTQMMLDTRNRVVMGGFGVILLANGIIGMAYLYVTRRYSYEKFLEKELEAAKVNAVASAEKYSGVVPVVQEAPAEPVDFKLLQEAEWRDQPKVETVSTQFGQVAAGKLSGMNEWQFQSAYEGAWKRPEQPISKVQWQANQGSMVQYEPQVQPWEIVQEGYDGR